MPNLFTPDLFTCAELSASVAKIPATPSLLARYFETGSSRTSSVTIDVENSRLTLVPDSKRGYAGPSAAAGSTRRAVAIKTSHLLQSDVLLAEDVQDVRAFGSTEAETVASRIVSKQQNLRRNIDVTMEFQRVGAVKGEVLDADGSTVLHDIYNTFGVNKAADISLTWPSDNTGATNAVLTAIQGAVMDIEDAMGGNPFTGVAAICGRGFWEKLVSNPFVREAYNLWAASQASFGQNDFRAAGFTYAGVTFYRYSQTVAGNTLVASANAHLFPTGPGIFKTIYAPADYMETVNTDGMPYYSKMEEMPMGRGYQLEVQSNPLMLCMFPEALRTIVGQ